MIFTVLLAAFPSLFYIIYYRFVILKKEVIQLNQTAKYLTLGFLSPICIVILYTLFPNFNHPITDDLIINTFFLAFFQVALVEELSKYWAFKVVKENEYNSPKATQFYYAVTSAGFAFNENIIYLLKFGNDAIFIRMFTATIAHIAFGVIVGYFIAKSKKFEKGSNILFGISLGVILHGIYDFNIYLTTTTPFTYVLIRTMFILFSLTYLGYHSIKTLKKQHFH